MDLPRTPAVQTVLDDLGDLGPAVAIHLAQHRDVYTDILGLSPSRQAARLITIADTLTAPVADPPAVLVAASPPAPVRPTNPVRAPSRPLSDAPAPVSQVAGGAQPTRSLAALAAADDDADAYIVRRAPESAAGRRIRR